MRNILRRPAVIVPLFIAVFIGLEVAQTASNRPLDRNLLLAALAYCAVAVTSALIVLRTRFGTAAMIGMAAITAGCIWAIYWFGLRGDLTLSRAIQAIIGFAGAFAVCAYNEWKHWSAAV